MYESITLSDGLHDEPFFQSRQLVRMDLEIVHAKSNKPLVTIQDQVNPPINMFYCGFQLGEYTIGELKKTLAGKKPKYRDINR